MSEEIINQIDNLLESNIVPSRHSYFQLNFFFMNKQPTIQSKMKQCLDELRVKKESFDNMIMELEDCADQKELLEIRQEKLVDSREDEINKRRLKRKYKSIERREKKIRLQMNGLLEEMTFFYQAFQKYNQQEPWKGWDDMDVQCEYWDKKIRQEINHRLMLGMPIDIEVLRTALSLPDKLHSKQQIVKLMEKLGQNKLIG